MADLSARARSLTFSPANLQTPARARGVSIGVNQLIAAMLISVSFYFRADQDGGGAAQYIAIGAYWAFGMLAFVLVMQRRVMYRDIASRTLNLLIAGIALLSLLSGFLAEVPFSDFIRVELRILSFCFATFLFSQYLLRGGSVEKLVSIAIVSTLVYALWASFMTVVIRGIPLFEARYRLLPGAVAMLIPFLLPTLRFQSWQGLIRLWPTAVMLVLLGLSQTRSAAGGIIVAVLVHLIVLLRFGNVARVASLVTIMIGGAVAVAILQPDVVDLWVSRIRTTDRASIDPTTITRLSEYTGQMRQLADSGQRLMFGAGPGARYTWDIETAREIIALGIIRDETGVNYFDFGHSLWVYSIFSMGLVGGFLIPIVLVGAFIRSFRLSLTLRLGGSARLMAHQVSLALVSLLLLGLASHPIADWHFGAIIGIFVAIAFTDPRTLSQIADGDYRRRVLAASLARRRGGANSNPASTPANVASA